MPIADFEAVLAREIERHNRRDGRRTPLAKGRSFLAVLEESLGASGTLVRRATAAQRRMLLLAAEGVTARKPAGELHVLGNRYWSEDLLDHMGERLTVRFDPQDLGQAIAVYTADNRFLCEADPLGDVAFVDEAAARTHARARKDYLRAVRDQLDAEQRLTIDDVAALAAKADAQQTPRPKAVRLVANGRPAPALQDETFEDFGRGIAAFAEGTLIPFVRKEEGGDEGS